MEQRRDEHRPLEVGLIEKDRHAQAGFGPRENLAAAECQVLVILGT